MKQIKIKQNSEEVTLSQKGDSVKIEILALGQTLVDGEAFFKAVELLKQHWEESKYKAVVEITEVTNCVDSNPLKQKIIAATLCSSITSDTHDGITLENTNTYS